MSKALVLMVVAIGLGFAVEASADGLPVDLYVTQEGAHVAGGPQCAQGYTTVGSFADCGGGQCWGNQRVCMKFVPFEELGFTTAIIQDVWMSPEGKHKVGGVPCPEGYTFRGSVADCGGGWCFGNQVFCVKQKPLFSVE